MARDFQDENNEDGVTNAGGGGMTPSKPSKNKEVVFDPFPDETLDVGVYVVGRRTTMKGKHIEAGTKVKLPKLIADEMMARGTDLTKSELY